MDDALALFVSDEQLVIPEACLSLSIYAPLFPLRHRKPFASDIDAAFSKQKAVDEPPPVNVDVLLVLFIIYVYPKIQFPPRS